MMHDPNGVFLGFLKQLGLSRTAIQSSDCDRNTPKCLRALAVLEEPTTHRRFQPDLARVREQDIPMNEVGMATFSTVWSLYQFVGRSYMQMMMRFEVFLNSGDQNDAQEAFTVALALACLTGHRGHLVSDDIRAGEFPLWIIMAYLVDYPEDLLSALQAVAEFGTSAVSFLLDAHGWRILEDFHCHARSSQCLPLPYPQFLFHVFSAVIADPVRGDQEAALAPILHSFEITPKVIDDLSDFGSCSDIREYFHRCMVLHYIHYARLLGFNDDSDLFDSLEYRLSANVLFSQPLGSKSGSLDLLFTKRLILRGDEKCRNKASLLGRGYIERGKLSADEFALTETGLDVFYEPVPYLSPVDGYLPCTIHLGILFLLAWKHYGYNREYLTRATGIFELVTRQSAIDEEIREAQWWLAFSRSNPDPRVLDGHALAVDIFMKSVPDVGVPWSQRAAKHTFSQWSYAAEEGDLSRLAQLLPLLQVTAANLDTHSEDFRDCKQLEHVSTLITERVDEWDDMRRNITSIFDKGPGAPVQELRTKVADTEAGSFSRLQLAREWARRSFEQGLPESVQAFQLYALLLQDNIPIASIAEQKHQILASEEWIKHWSDTAVTAVVRHGGPDDLSLAVEFLEQSRSVTYRHLFQLRQENRQLSSTHPDLAKRWLHLSSMIRDEFQTRIRNIHEMSAEALEFYDHSTIHSLVVSHNSLLEEIRQKPGLEGFLRPLKYEELRMVADEGPVIMLSSDPQTELSHALIILPGRGQPVYLQLPKAASFSEISGHSNDLAQLVAGDGQMTRRGWEMDTKPADKDALRFQRILEWLWDHVVNPVFDALQTAGYTSGRVWWCPSGNFTLLPLHAAAMLDPHCSMISSYTPSLEALIDSRRRGPASDDTMMPRRLAAIGLQSCPRRGELQPLYAVEAELEIFFEDNGNNYHAMERKKFEGPDAQVESVLDVMKTSHIVHLACHGIQDSSDPLNSHLILYDNELSLRAIINENLPSAEFAFLSACQTATGHKELANESVHLAGGFIAAGFKGVVGTVWSIADRDAPRVVQRVYEGMVTQEGGFDVRKAAEGLHRAVQGMIKQGFPPRRWAPFIHVGI